MPVTPFHFGPGTLLKACAPRSVSLAAFVASQILIDTESGYHLFWGGWPLHREAHSLLLSSLIGLLGGATVWLLGRRWRSSSHGLLRSEVELRPAILGGLAGGISHPLLDSVMHFDLQPFWPVSAQNPLLAAVSLWHLHAFCLISGIGGVLVLVFRLFKAGRVG